MVCETNRGVPDAMIQSSKRRLRSQSNPKSQSVLNSAFRETSRVTNYKSQVADHGLLITSH